MRRASHLLATLTLAAPLAAQRPATAAPEPIRDNSFLIEEAYNQEAGVVQHVSTFQKGLQGRGWGYSFTQEWPMPGQRHQASVTVPVARMDGPASAPRGLGDVMLNYRYQLAGVGGGRLALAPRLSAVLPTGNVDQGLGAGGAGVQANLPLSIEHGGRLVTHWNAGLTYTPSARDGAGATASTTSYNLGQSVVWLAGAKVNLLVETAWSRVAAVAGPAATAHATQLFISPGVRWAHDFTNGLQVVPGLAFPIGLGESRGERAAFVYLSFEHAF